MRLAELQQNDKRIRQLLYSIGQMLKESSTSCPTPYPLSCKQELFLNKWKLRRDFKYDLISKMKDGKEKTNRKRSSGDQSKKKTVLVEYLVMKCGIILRVWSYLHTPISGDFEKKSSGDELQEESSSNQEEDDELEEEDEDIDKNDNQTPTLTQVL